MTTEHEREHARLAAHFASVDLAAHASRHKASELRGLVERAEQAGHSERAADYRAVLRAAQAEAKRLAAEATAANAALAKHANAR